LRVQTTVVSARARADLANAIGAKVKQIQESSLMLVSGSPRLSADKGDDEFVGHTFARNL
jgi:hypothetical protein